jgi:peptide/nickel transport system substrate-binding protein/oligopeptide transport system substrate-binding protein
MLLKQRLNINLIFILLFILNTVLPETTRAGSEKLSTDDEENGAPVFGGTYRRGLVHDPVTLDPAKMTDIYEEVVTQQVVEGLVQYSDNLMVVPCLAKSWKSSRDNLRWVFYLKKGVKFHNGREVTADDFIYTFSRILDPASGSGASSLLSKVVGAREFMAGERDEVQGLRSLDRYTLEIRLSEPFPPFIAILAMTNFGVIPREEVERLGEGFGFYPVGTGPFKFERWDHNHEIVLTANEEYHEGRPYLDRVAFRIYPGSTTELMFSEFENGSLEDSLFPADKRKSLVGNSIYSLLRRPSFSVRMLVMNNMTKPFDDKRVRQAFNYAIDKETLSREIGKGRLIPATGLIPGGMPGYKPDDINYPYSPEKALELLKEAGYPGGRGLPVIQFWSSVKSKGLLEEDKAIGKYLFDIGVEVQFNYLTDWPAFKKMLEAGKAPMFKYSWEADVPDPDNILSSLFHSQSLTNRAFYFSPAVDELIEKAQNESNYTRRIDQFATVHDMIVDDAPVILLNYLAYERVFQNYVRNFEGNALGDHYFSLKRVWLEIESTD